MNTPQTPPDTPPDELLARLKKWLEENLPDTVRLYRHLHAHPELSCQEKKTAARLAEEFEALGAKVTTQVGGHGVAVLLENGAGPTVMLRADMDALPVVEETGLSYASKVKTVMHACGHDVHMANLVGVARCLAAHRNRWRGTALFVCQPAEEQVSGAKAMLDDGLFTRFPKPGCALALHVDSNLATGRIGYRPGYCFASGDTIDVTLLGRGGHGAFPHKAIDPIVMGAALVLDLQTIVSREIDPVESAVVAVGSFHAGTRANIIGEACKLEITVRSYSDRVQAHLLEAISRKAKAIAMGARAPEPKIHIREGGIPALCNDGQLVARLLPVFGRIAGAENVELVQPIMGGEDFSLYGQAGVPIFMWRVGAVNEKRLAEWASKGIPAPPLHSPRFYPDAEETLRLSILTMVSGALEMFHGGKR